MRDAPAEREADDATCWSTVIQGGLNQEEATQLAQTYVGARSVQDTVIAVAAKLVADEDDEPWRPKD